MTMEGKSLLVVAVIVEAVALALVSAGLVLMRSPASGPAPTEMSLEIQILALSENVTDDYGRPANADWVFLTLRVDVWSHLTAPVQIDNGSFSLVAGVGAVEYNGELAPPGPFSISAGRHDYFWVAFEVPRGLHTEKVRLLTGGRAAEAAFSYQVNPEPPPPPLTMGLLVSPTGMNWSVLIQTTPGGLPPTSTYLMIKDTQGVIRLARTAWSGLTPESWAANKAFYQDANPSVIELRPGDGLLIDRTTYPTGCMIVISDDDQVISTRILQ